MAGMIRLQFTKESNWFYGQVNRSTDSLVMLLSLLRGIKSRRCLHILLGKGDYNFDKAFLQKLHGSYIKICGNNLNIESPNAFYLPMGRDFRSKNYFDRVQPTIEKQRMIYANFSVNTHPMRQALYSLIQNDERVECEHMGEFLNYSIARDDFYKKLSTSKFVLCPRGNAIDTFRMWDCLYLGAIPVVVKEAYFHRLLEDLPIFFVDRFEDFLSLSMDEMNDIYNRFLTSEFNYGKLNLSYWLDEFTAQ